MRSSFAALALLAFASFVVAEERKPWTSSNVKGSPEPPKPFRTERVFPNLEFDRPVEMLRLPGTDKMLLLEVGGKVFSFDDDPACNEKHLVIDLKQCMKPWRNAFGINVHPDFENNRQVFIVYAGNPAGREDGSRLSRFLMSNDDPPTIDPASEEVLLTWHSGGHNGSTIRFDADGYLYFSTGDGAKPYPPDEHNVSQDLTDLRSSVCRIDVNKRDDDLPYAIPPDNPFVNTPGARGEIWAYGFRNPWRFCIDRESGRMLLGDVGWELWELIFHVERSGNYGWSIFEGPQPIRSDIQRGPTPIRKPLVAYPHTEGLSVTGGFIYHGSEFPELQGAYLYGDYVTGKLWAMRFDGQKVASNEVVAETGLKIISFAETREREVIVMSYDGSLHRLVKNEAAGKPSRFPRLLSATGLFVDTGSLQPAAGVYGYSLTATSFNGNTSSNFHVAIPADGTIRGSRQRRNWKYPVGTVFAKTLSTNVSDSQESATQRIETQLLHFDGTAWQPYAYRWNEDQQDAQLIDKEGASFSYTDENGESQTWRIQSRSECRACHTTQTGGAVGFDFANLNNHNQIDRFVKLGLIDAKPPKNWNVKDLVDPRNASASLDLRARSYLALNCAHCHCPGGGGTVALNLTFGNDTSKIFAVDFPTTQGRFGLDDAARVIVPGNPYKSVLYYRMATSGVGHMPKIWDRDNDTLGLSLVHDWIAKMPSGAAEVSTNAAQPSEAVSTDEILRLFTQIERGALSGSQRDRIIKDAVSQGDPIKRGLFERFISPSERTERLGNSIDENQILAMAGDAKRGENLFLHSNATSCRNCHQIAGEGQAYGPAFDHIGKKRTAAEILSSILRPADKIEPEYVGYSVLMIDGIVHTGLRVRQDANEIVLRSRSGASGKAKDLTILMDDVDQLSVQRKSLMPDGLAADLTAQELADLIAFIVSLK